MTPERPRSRTPIIVVTVLIAAIAASATFVALGRSGTVPQRAVNLLAVEGGIRSCVERTDEAVFCAHGFERGGVDIDTTATGDEIDAITASTKVDGVTYEVATPVDYDGAGFDASGPRALSCAPRGSGACDDAGTWTASRADATAPTRSTIDTTVDDALAMVEQVNAAFPSMESIDDELLERASEYQVSFLKTYVAAATDRVANPGSSPID